MPRTPEHVSPTSLHLFEWSRDQYACRYLIEPKPEREPQTPHMAIGSAFDAAVKSVLHEFFYGFDPEWSFDAIFEKQVEPHVRDMAQPIGKYLLGIYRDSGALEKLVGELSTALSKPRFEFAGRTEVGGVPLMGKPDLFFIDTEGNAVIYDWKVMGWFSKSIQSPSKGYRWCWDIRTGKSVPHKTPGLPMNQCDKKWADQLTMYGWIMGQEPGDPTHIGIDQFCGPVAKLRIARHRSVVDFDYQLALLGRLQSMWEAVQNWPQDELRLLEENLNTPDLDWM